MQYQDVVYLHGLYCWNPKVFRLTESNFITHSCVYGSSLVTLQRIAFSSHQFFFSALTPVIPTEVEFYSSSWMWMVILPVFLAVHSSSVSIPVMTAVDDSSSILIYCSALQKKRPWRDIWNCLHLSIQHHLHRIREPFKTSYSTHHHCGSQTMTSHCLLYRLFRFFLQHFIRSHTFQTC